MSNIISGTSVWISSTQGNNEGVAHFYSISYNSCDSYTTLMRETRSEKVAKECFLVVRDKLKKNFIRRHISTQKFRSITLKHYWKSSLRLCFWQMRQPQSYSVKLSYEVQLNCSSDILKMSALSEPSIFKIFIGVFVSFGHMLSSVISVSTNTS